MKKILYIICAIIFLISLLICIFSIFHLSFFNYRIYRVSSGSMKPYLKINDYILVKKINDYEVNDVITYQIDDTYITHRIVSIEEDIITTRGDANNKEDDPIRKDNIIGKVVIKFVTLSFILSLFSSPIMWILILIIGVVITMLIPDKKKK